MEDSAGKMFGARDIFGEQQAGLNRAKFRHAGVDQFLDAATGQYNPDTWIQGDARFKNLYNNLNQSSFVDFNPTLNARLGQIEQGYHNWTNATGPTRGVTNWFDKIRDIGVNGGRLSGPDAQSWRSELVDVRKGLSPKTAEFNAIDSLVKLIDDSLESNTPASMRGRRQSLNREYSNYKLLEEASKAAGSTSGYISPAIARAKAANRNSHAYARGTSDIGELAKAAEHVMKRKPSSGTAERALGTGAIGGAIGLPTMATGAVIGRLITSDAIQRLLGGGYQTARAARAATPIDREAIMRAGILGLLSSK
jgi:hypothetical protein